MIEFAPPLILLQPLHFLPLPAPAIEPQRAGGGSRPLSHRPSRREERVLWYTLVRTSRRGLRMQPHLTSQDQPELSTEEMPDSRNTLNDMSGDRFLYFMKSVLSTSYASVYSHELRKQHGANKPSQLMALLIEFFTKTGMSVLDPFAGVGGTLIGASIATPGASKCVGIEINQQWTEIYARVLKDNPGLLPQTMIQGDCIDVMDRLLANECTFWILMAARFVLKKKRQSATSL
jgi:hypothetical protein